MKKQLLTIVSMAVLSAGSFVANAQVPNGSLEAWTNNSLYDDPDGDILKTLNVIATFPENPPVTCFKDANAHGGSFCARIVANEVTSLNIFVPGVLGTVTPFFQPEIGADLAKPYSGRPETLKAWIKYAPVTGDSGQIFSYMLKQNGSTFETLAVATKRFLQPVSNWTEQVLTYNYSNTTDIATHISLIFITSKDYDFSNLANCHGSVNSTMWVDDVELVGYNGVSEMLFTGEELNVFPNPTSDILTISVTEMLSNANLSIVDMNGRTISSTNVSGNQFSVDVNTLAAGNYSIVLKQNSTVLGRKTFVKK